MDSNMAIMRTHLDNLENLVNTDLDSLLRYIVCLFDSESFQNRLFLSICSENPNRFKDLRGKYENMDAMLSIVATKLQEFKDRVDEENRIFIEETGGIDNHDSDTDTISPDDNDELSDTDD